MIWFKIGWALILSIPTYLLCKFVMGFLTGVHHALKDIANEEHKKHEASKDDDQHTDG